MVTYVIYYFLIMILPFRSIFFSNTCSWCFYSSEWPLKPYWWIILNSKFLNFSFAFVVVNDLSFDTSFQYSYNISFTSSGFWPSLQGKLRSWYVLYIYFDFFHHSRGFFTLYLLKIDSSFCFIYLSLILFNYSNTLLSIFYSS